MVRNSTRLIELVRANPCLYDRAHPLYLNVAHKRELWDGIGRALDVPPGKCKTRWNNMRDSYRKAALKNTRSYKYSRHLSFLNRFLRTEVPLDAGDEEAPAGDDDGDWDDGSSGWGDVKAEPAGAPPSPEYRDVSGYYVPEPAPPAPPAPCLDPVDAFLAGVAPVLKALGPLELSRAKMEIYQVVHKYELRALQAAGEGAAGAPHNGGDAPR
ncbi:uncharacterized protein LOC121735224 [Aricia agestis]|uniref:uncharacterized protein LOC121735224 n=1 Tax=Aricia agestis TaxID=91739 RepID=UPI001C203E04|nr:uncharacterized protein LOC121735224 [Aricia agestis]XP_041981901.1 uncharacterized protein LOC121735224 [Aricia agestis]XP_041981902.1 uncharacterized protein LOC121735224 [Aricia agestis]XP_041981903.1 uncharacterized protein LOC121735224 [Aricia agestis]